MGQSDYLTYAIAYLRTNQSLTSQIETAKHQKRSTLTVTIEVPAMIVNAVQQYLADPMGKPVSSMTTTEKIGEAIKRSLPMLPGDVVDEVKSLLAPEALAVVAAVVIIWAGSHFFGVGEIADVILLIIGVAALGGVAWKAGEELINFSTKAVNATTEEDLNQAAKHFSEAVALIGIQVIMALIFKARPKTFNKPFLRPYTLKTLPPVPRTPGSIFYKSKIAPAPYLGPGVLGSTDAFGDIKYLSTLTGDARRLTLIHERVHSFLTPKLQVLREVRIVLATNSYSKSFILRYLEEALAETIARVTVIGWQETFTGIAFPVKNGYVTVLEIGVEATGTLLGPINAGGMMYRAYFTYTKPSENEWREANPDNR